MSRAIALIVKEPSSPLAKTRLAATVGRAAAGELALAMLLDSAETLAAAAPAEVELVLYHDPPDAGERLLRAGVPARFRTLPQPSGDLGQRLAHVTALLLGRGHSACAVAAADSPHGVISALEAARPAQPGEILLGPCEDGGYWVVGLDRPAAIFDIAMSTDDVLAETVARAEQLGRPVRMLERLLDFDTWEDLLAAEARGLLAAAPRTREAVSAVGARVA